MIQGFCAPQVVLGAFFMKNHKLYFYGLDPDFGTIHRWECAICGDLHVTQSFFKKRHCPKTKLTPDEKKFVKGKYVKVHAISC